jgi:hypothetical protein
MRVQINGKVIVAVTLIDFRGVCFVFIFFRAWRNDLAGAFLYFRDTAAAL